MSQIFHILPKSDWRKVVIKENNDPVIFLKETEKLIFGKNIIPYIIIEYKTRKTVADMLNQVSKNLPDYYKLVVVEGVRSPSQQKEHWDKKTLEFKKLHPEWSQEKMEYEVGLVVARPTPLANHNCGGAVDVTLMYKNELVDMGTPPHALLEKDRVEMFSKLITPEQVENRRILRDAMEGVGFVWYPGEWWHYCYGDRMWAVYSEKSECFYGPIEK
jgi:D-alanyl-D-alanine dipeptidase